MKKRTKIFIIIIGVFLALVLTIMPLAIYIACHWKEDCSEEARADFSTFYTSDKVALVIDEIVMFEDHSVDLRISRREKMSFLQMDTCPITEIKQNIK